MSNTSAQRTADSVARARTRGFKQLHRQIPIRDEQRIMDFIDQCKRELVKDINSGVEKRWVTPTRETQGI